MSRASTDPDEASAELARWLVEVGRRRWSRRAAQAQPAARPRRQAGVLHRLVILGALAAALFQYLYLDALLQVASLRSLIVFVLSGGHG